MRNDEKCCKCGAEIFEENGVEWKDKEKFLEKNETEKRREIFQS